MVTIIAEKPSVGRDLARIVGAGVKCEGYMVGNGYAVTWAFGHLVQIFSPNADVPWMIDTLPILPDQFYLQVGEKSGMNGRKEPDSGYLKQLGIIRKLFNESDYIINAGDAGREGELIQRYIYAFVGCNKPVKRLWISSLTDNAIREGLANLMPSSDFDNLYYAGKARNEADWLVGINATRALTIHSGGHRLMSLGRVQTPTLGMVCRRFYENRDFVPQTFWNLKAAARKNGTVFVACTKDRYYECEKVEADMKKVADCGTLTVTKMEKKAKSLQPPYLHDLTSLQKEANRKYNISAQECLDTAQSLYEKKLLTYPRTGSRFIPDDVFAKLPALIEIQQANPLFREQARNLAGASLNRHSVDKTKVTDHHALLPTENLAIGLGDMEQKIYNLVVARMLESVSPKCDMLSTSVEFDSYGVCFTCKGNVIVSPGWKAILKEKEKESDDDSQTLPEFTKGDVIKILRLKAFEGKTKPKPLHTEASLLECMEHAGKEVDENDLKEALKDVGIGTPATRAGEIETLLNRKYMVKQGKSLVPTELGLSIYEKVKDSYICDVRMTAQWEKALSNIVDGKTSPLAFDKSIRRFTVALTDELLGRKSVR